MDRLRRDDNTQLRKARQVVRVQHLRMFDAMTQTETDALFLGRFDGIEHVAVGLIANRMNRHRQTQPAPLFRPAQTSVRDW